MNSCETPNVWKFETIQALQNNYLNYHLKTLSLKIQIFLKYASKY